MQLTLSGTDGGRRKKGGLNCGELEIKEGLPTFSRTNAYLLFFSVEGLEIMDVISFGFD